MVQNQTQLSRSTSLATVAPQASKMAVAVYPDGPRYKFGFGVASQSSTRIYKISFDAAPGALYFTCSCPGNLRYGTCKHLKACGLKGRADMSKNEGRLFAKQHGFLT